MALKGGGQVSVTTTAQSLTTLLSLTSATRIVFKQLSVRINPASANTIYWGGSAVTNVPANAKGALVAATTPGFTWGPADYLPTGNTDDVYFVATTGTTVMFVDIVQ